MIARDDRHVGERKRIPILLGTQQSDGIVITEHALEYFTVMKFGIQSI
jgi:hypothetical protein